MSIIRLVGRSKSKLLVTILLNCLVSVCSVCASLVLTNIVDYTSKGDYRLALISLAANIGFFGVAMIVNYFYERLKNSINKDALNHYRGYVAEYISTGKDHMSTDDCVSLLNNDSSTIADAVDLFFTLTDAGISMVLAFVALLYIHWTIALTAVGVFVFNMLAPTLLQKRANDNELRKSANANRYLSSLSDMLGGFDVWNVYNAKDKLRELMDKIGHSYEDEQHKINNTYSLIGLVSGMFSLVSQLFPPMVVVLLVMQGKAVAGHILSVGNLSGSFSGNVARFMNSIVKVDGVNALLKEKFPEYEKEDRSIKHIEGYDIRINDLTFAYGEEPVIREFTHTFEYGKKYLVVGASGCGKTTLLNILSSRLSDYSGDISIGGIDYRNINHYSLREYIGYVMQNPYVFADTIRNNITLYRNVEEKQIETAGARAGLNEFVGSYDDMVDKNVTNYSGGQKQRIAIARELLAHHKVIMFDESTNALDKEASDRMIDMLMGMEQTIIFVAHNYDERTIARFDEVIRL